MANDIALLASRANELSILQRARDALVAIAGISKSNGTHPMISLLGTNIRRGLTVVSCCILFLSLADSICAAPDEFLSDPNFDAIPKNWVQVELSKVSDILFMIGGQLRELREDPHMESDV